jgi:hypothetical protein
VPLFECECKHSHGEQGREKGGNERSIEASACRQGGEVYWIVSLSGLVAGFVYEFHFQCFVVEGADKHRHYTWTNNFSTSTSSYTVRQPLYPISQKTRSLNIDTSVWDACIPTKDLFVIEVTVRDLHPGLTSEEALIGTRNMNSAVNSVRVHCTDSYSAEESQYNFIDAEALGNSQEHQNDGGTVPTHLTHAYTDEGTAGQHALDHPAIVIDLPELECECEYSHLATTSSGREQSGADSSILTRTCREGGEVYWIVPVRGLVAGFVFEVHFDWSLDLSGENAHHWNTVFTPSASSYTVKHPLEKGQQTRALNIHTSTRDSYVLQKEPFFVEATVRDMRPGLTSEEALIGIRRLNSAVNTVRVRCADLESGERMPDVGEDEWKYNFSAAIEDVRISYSETVVALAMLNRYGLDEWARNSQNMSDDENNVLDLHIPAVVFNHKQDGRRAFAEGLLRAVGFRDITFPPAYESATLDLAALENSGRVSANWDYFVKEQMGWKYISNSSKMRYIAHALDFQDVIERHVGAVDGSASASSWIAVFEDDLVLTTSPVQAHKRLFEAVSSLPGNADVLHVEWCNDRCEESRFHTKYPLISLASRPHCSAGVLLSTQGARKLDRMLRPVDSTIENMLAGLCHRMALYCYKLRLPIFTQDKKWDWTFDFTKQKEVRRMFSTNS